MAEQASPISAEKQIDILLTEYVALRQELTQQQSSALSLYGIAATAAAGVWLLFESKISLGGASIIILAAALFARVVYRSLEYSMRNWGTRLRQLEIEVNQLAGAELLKWERLYGGTLPEQRRLRAEMIFGRKVSGTYLRARDLLQRRLRAMS